MDKFEIAIKNLEDMAEVGGTLAEADEVISLMRELYVRYQIYHEMFLEFIEHGWQKK